MLPSGPRDPKSAVSLEQTKKRGADSADGWLDPFAPAFFDQSDRRAIRHHEQPWRYFIPPAGRLGNLGQGIISSRVFHRRSLRPAEHQIEIGLRSCGSRS
jgi:hypothetical protein